VGKVNYKVEIEGFEGQQIEVVPPGFFTSARLLVDGRPADRQGLTGSMALLNNQGIAVEARWIPRALGLDVPFLSVGGQVISFADPLQWYQWLWGGWSVVVLVLAGHVIGLIPALIATLFNIQIFRSSLGRPLQYMVTALVSILAVLVYRAIALSLALLWA
jgi:hypothetical protein